MFFWLSTQHSKNTKFADSISVPPTQYTVQRGLGWDCIWKNNNILFPMNKFFRHSTQYSKNIKSADSISVPVTQYTVQRGLGWSCIWKILFLSSNVFFLWHNTCKLRRFCLIHKKESIDPRKQPKSFHPKHFGHTEKCTINMSKGSGEGGQDPWLNSEGHKRNK